MSSTHFSFSVLFFWGGGGGGGSYIPNPERKGSKRPEDGGGRGWGGAEILSAPLHDKSRPREDGRHCLTTTEAQKGRTESALPPSDSHAAYRSMQGPQNPVHCLLTLTTAVGRGKDWLHMKLLDIQCPVQRDGRLSYHISGWSTSGWSASRWSATRQAV